MSESRRYLFMLAELPGGWGPDTRRRLASHGIGPTFAKDVHATVTGPAQIPLRFTAETETQAHAALRRSGVPGALVPGLVARGLRWPR